jgi:hypothetical protein
MGPVTYCPEFGEDFDVERDSPEWLEHVAEHTQKARSALSEPGPCPCAGNVPRPCTACCATRNAAGIASRDTTTKSTAKVPRGRVWEPAYKFSAHGRQRGPKPRRPG